MLFTIFVFSLQVLQTLCDDFNNWSDEKRSSSSSSLLLLESKKASNAQIKFIMQFIYNRAISDPDKLNQYEPFSPQVYGETSFDLIEQMLTRVQHLKENDIFVDLGSGKTRLLFVKRQKPALITFNLLKLT